MSCECSDNPVRPVGSWVAVEAAMDYLGLPAGPPRLPLKPMRGEKLEKLHKLLDEFQLREKYGL